MDMDRAASGVVIDVAMHLLMFSFNMRSLTQEKKKANRSMMDIRDERVLIACS